MSGTAGKTWTSTGCRRSGPQQPPGLTPADIHQLAADGLLVEHLRLSGMTWEAVPSGERTVDQDLWQAVLPQLGVMAAIRNACNLDEAGITTRRWPSVRQARRPEQVRRFRVMPMRFYAAYKAVSERALARAPGGCIAALAVEYCPPWVGTR